MLGIKLMALHMLGKHLSPELHVQPLYVLFSNFATSEASNGIIYPQTTSFFVIINFLEYEKFLEKNKLTPELLRSLPTLGPFFFFFCFIKYKDLFISQGDSAVALCIFGNFFGSVQANTAH